MRILSRLFASHIYSVMNDDHAELYRIIDLLSDAARQPGGTDRNRLEKRAVCLELVTRLRVETAAHFKREEGLMIGYDYPLARLHAKEHLVLLRTMDTFVLNLRHGLIAIAPKAVSHLKDWLTRHIRTSDTHLETFLATCTERRSAKRADLSATGGHPLTQLLSLSDTVSPEIVAANRLLRANYEVDVTKRRKRAEQAARAKAVHVQS